jgi:hypothetical protein
VQRTCSDLPSLTRTRLIAGASLQSPGQRGKSGSESFIARAKDGRSFNRSSDARIPAIERNIADSIPKRWRCGAIGETEAVADDELALAEFQTTAHVSIDIGGTVMMASITNEVAPHSAALKPKHAASCKVQSLRGARLPPRQAIRFPPPSNPAAVLASAIIAKGPGRDLALSLRREHRELAPNECVALFLEV